MHNNIRAVTHLLETIATEKAPRFLRKSHTCLFVLYSPRMGGLLVRCYHNHQQAERVVHRDTVLLTHQKTSLPLCLSIKLLEVPLSPNWAQWIEYLCHGVITVYTLTSLRGGSRRGKSGWQGRRSGWRIGLLQNIPGHQVVSMLLCIHSPSSPLQLKQI